MISRVIQAGLLFLLALPAAHAADCPPGDRETTPVYRETPAYPHGARMFCVEGEVHVEFRVGPDGNIAQAEILRSEPPGVFDRETLATVARWYYQPACRNGEAVLSEARQVVIEFELEEELLLTYACPENIDEETADILAEITSWYALLAEWMLTRPGEPVPATLVPDVSVDHAGDHRLIREFHRDSIEMIVSRASEVASFALQRNLNRLLDFERAALDPELVETRALLESVRRDLLHYADVTLQLWQGIADAYIELAQDSSFDSDTRALLVYPFVGNPNFDPPFSSDLATEHVADLEALVALLQQGQWTFENGEVNFQRNAQQRQFLRLLDSIQQRTEYLNKSARRSLAGFRDYL